MNKEGERALGLMRWGFKLPKKLLFNVRSEGIATANFWKVKFATNRCIVPASSFFEWKDSKKGPKSKYEIKVLDREFFGIAAVWAEWRNPKTQKWEKTFATFTSEPKGIMRELHDRQPVILDPKDFQGVAFAERTLACSFAPHPTRRRDTRNASRRSRRKAGEAAANEGLFD